MRYVTVNYVYEWFVLIWIVLNCTHFLFFSFSLTHSLTLIYNRSFECYMLCYVVCILLLLYCTIPYMYSMYSMYGVYCITVNRRWASELAPRRVSRPPKGRGAASNVLLTHIWLYQAMTLSVYESMSLLFNSQLSVIRLFDKEAWEIDTKMKTLREGEYELVGMWVGNISFLFFAWFQFQFQLLFLNYHVYIVLNHSHTHRH